MARPGRARRVPLVHVCLPFHLLSPDRCAPPPQVANRLRLELAVLNDLRFSAASKDSLDLASHRALAWQAALAQPTGAPLTLGEQTVRLAAVRAGLVDDHVSYPPPPPHPFATHAR